MDEKYIEEVYNGLGGEKVFGGFEDFKKLITSDDSYQKDVHSSFGESVLGSFDDFKALVSKSVEPKTPKKKEYTPSPVLDGQSDSQEIDQSGNVFVPGKGIDISRKSVSPGITDQTQEVGTTFDPNAGPYKPGQGIDVSDAVAPVQVDEIDTGVEKPFFTGNIGAALKLIDNPAVPMGALGIGDFIDDIGRGVAAGYAQGKTIAPISDLYLKGGKVSDEDLEKYMIASKDLERFGPSDEMRAFNKTIEEEGDSWFGFFKGVGQNPSILGELLVSSYSAMANPVSISSGLGTVGTAAAGGAVAGAIGGAGAGAVPGAIGGALASIPVALAVAGGTLEVAATFSELLNEKLSEQGLDFTKENIRKILEDEESLNKIRAKSAAKGATIGVFDALTGRLAGKVGAKMLRKAPSAKARALAVGSGIEAGGAFTGDAAGRLAAGQEQSISESALEGFADTPMSLLNVTAEVLRNPIYKVNGERVTEETLNDLINNSSPEDLSKMNIQIDNDNKGYVEKIQEIVVDESLKSDVVKANPDLNDNAVVRLVQLEKNLKSLEGNKTEAGRQRVSEIKSQIKSILEDDASKVKDQEVVDQTIPEEISSLEDDQTVVFSVKTLEEVPDQFKDRAQLSGLMETETREKILGLPIGKKEKKLVGGGYTYTLTGKEAKDYAIQEQAASEVLVQPETRVGEEVAQTAFEGVAQESQQAEALADVESTAKEVEAKRIETEAKIKRKDLFSDGGVFANELGGSGVNSVPTNHSEINGIEFVQFSNPNTGVIDVIMTGKSDNDFVGYYRIYENGKATDRWSSKFENQSRNKEDFKTMISGVQEMLPQGHEYTEKTSISTDGLRVWNQQLSRGYELQYDNKGNLITNRVAINGDAINNELGISVNRGNFENISVTNNSDIKKVKEALLPYLQKFGLNESNIYFENGTAEIDLPVLRNKTEQDVIQEQAASEVPVQSETIVSQQVDQVEISPLSDLLTADTKDKTTLGKIEDFLSNLESQLDDIGREGLGVNLALPLVKAIVKGLRVAVRAGATLQEAIRKVSAENNVSEKDVMDSLNYVAESKKGDPSKLIPATIESEISDIISEQKSLGKSARDTAIKAIEFIKSTSFYENLSDKDKSKVIDTVKKLSGIRAKVTVDEYASLKDQIKLEAKAAREGVKSYKDASKAIISSIRAMGSSGKISTRKAVVMISRVARTNMLNKKSVDKTLDYLAEIFSNAELAAKISKARQLSRVAKKNIKSKIGQAPELYPVLKTLLSVDPVQVPLANINEYLEILQEFGARKKELTLTEKNEMLAKVNNIVNSITMEDTNVDKTDGDGSKKMSPELVDQSIKDLAGKKLDTSRISDKNEQKVANFLSSITEADIRELYDVMGDKILNDLNGVMLNIEAGYVTFEANSIKEKVEQNRAKKELFKATSKASKISVFNAVSKLMGAVKAALKRTTSTLEMTRSLSTEFIDDAFGNFNSKTIYNNTFGKLASAMGSLNADLSIIAAKADAANILFNKGRTNNESVLARAKVMAILLQKEYDSNPGSKSVSPAIDFIKDTIDAIERRETGLPKYNATVLRKILDNYVVDGKVSIDKLEQSLSSEDKKAMALIVDINQSTADKALYTSAVIRGNRVDMINNYVHHHVIGESAANDSRNIIESLSGSSVTDRPSTRSETLTKRQPGSKPINFDPVSSAYRGAKMTLTDFHMTSAVRVVTGTIRRMKETIKADEKSTRDQNDAVYALDKAIKEALNITFVNSFSEYTSGDKIIQGIRTLGYYSSLASIPRAAAELGSNLNYAIFRDPGALVLASNYTTFAYSSDLLGFLGNIGSEASTRIAGNDILTGKYAESGLMGTFGKSGTSNATSKVVDYISFIKKNTTDKLVESAELISEYLISSPDKAISKPFYIAVFAREFEKNTGVKLTEADMKEMSEGTSKYLSPEYSSAIESSRRKADTDITRMSASNNSFNMVLKNAPRKSDSVLIASYRAANSFMSKHLLTEHGTMRSAVASLFHSGDIDKKTATAILAASTTRMVSYSVLSSVLYGLFDTIIANVFDMDTEEDDEELSDLTLRSIVGTGVNAMVRRSIGNVPFIPIAFGIEALNEEYGDDIRSGKDYNPYENSVAYAQISKKDLETKSLPEIIAKTSAGPFGPLIGSSTRAAKLTYTAFFSETSKQSTKEKAIDELENRMLFELAGNLGMLPLYKDIRRIILKDMFSDIDSKKGNGGLQFTNKQIDQLAKTNPELARRLREIKKQHEKIK